ncbi:DUF3080 family protein [Pseudoalteromonas sp. BDTF-M6]|uniref:DUF3080 family protein n=1 Tax=Pseudoalteromonas sp. BDTF-M6 TaxID=2796132 RepID=UPI001BAEF953|nr:DUF3080 family protein [Pseudoalteromonas sp. BDTF-M6]MBS3796544.1 DUF3080 family protein [Pseudoalteromonas sp. BDTF-M6]
MHKLLLIFSTLIILGGCSDPSSARYNEYQYRLGKYLTIDQQAQVRLTPWQRLHSEPLPPSQNISLLALADINHCRLATHIAARNNQLGKVASASERFKYHIRFIQLVDPCLAHDQSNALSEELRSALEAEKRFKITHAKQAFNLMLSQEPELTRLFTLAARELDYDEQAGRAASAEALTTLADVANAVAKEDWQAIDAKAITPALAKLNGNDYVRKLLTGARQQIALNNHLTSQLAGVSLTTEVCRPGRHSDAAGILHNIFNLFFLKELQGYQGQLSGSLEEFTPLLAQVWQFTGSDSDIRRSLIGTQEQASLLARLKASSRNHVRWWQGFYKQCDISPV